MVQRIIYPSEDGGVNVLICHKSNGAPLSSLSIEEVARKDVPEGVPYRFVDEADIPADRTQRALWSADFSKPDGIGGAK